MNEPMRRQFLTRTVVATCLLVFCSHCSLQKASLYQAFRRPSPNGTVMAIQAVEVLLVHFLGWVLLRALRQAHRGAVSFITVLVLRQTLEYFLGCRVVQFVPFHTSPSRECFGLKPSGSSVSSALGDWRGGPVPLGIWAGSPCKTYWYVTWEHRPGTRPRLE